MLNIGIIGAGTVGTGVVKVLNQKKTAFEDKIGDQFRIKKVAVNNLHKQRDEAFTTTSLTSNATEIIQDPEIDIVVELMGGEEPAYSLIKQAIQNGKHIVTANKEVIAKHSETIFSLAEENNVFVSIEGAVAGGIPIIQTLKRDLIANKVNILMGIINGTTNYILTEMTQKKRDFADVLKEAQQLGYAEADPSSDIDGFDSAYKLAIIASLIFQHKINLEEVHREGIARVSVKDIENAAKLGYIIKLLAIAKHNPDGSCEARVHPTMIPNDHPLAAVNDAFNAIWLHGDSVGEFMLYGRGAGQLPTASAVVADILNVAIEMKLKKHHNLFHPEKYLKLASIENISSMYYLRLRTKDKPGVIGIIGKELGHSDVSINALWQDESKGDTAEIVLITHPVLEANMQKAISSLTKAEEILEICNLIRVEE